MTTDRPALTLNSRSLRVALGALAVTLLDFLLLLRSPELSLVLPVAVVVGWVAWRAPEFVLVPSALLIPSGHFVTRLQIHVGSHGYLTIFQVVGFFVFFVSFAHGRFRGCRSAGSPFMVAFVVAGVLAAIGSGAFEQSMYWVLNTGLLVGALTYVFAGRLKEDPRSVHLTVVFVGTVLACVSLFEWRLHHALLESFYREYYSAYVPGSSAAFRPPALTGNPLTTSASVAITFAVALTTPYLKKWRWVPLVLLAGGAFVSLSRSSIALIVVAIGTFALTGWADHDAERSRRRHRLLILGVPVLVVATAWVVPHVSNRLGGVSVFSADGRTQNGETAWHIFTSDPRPTGIGLGGYKRLETAQPGANAALPTTVDDQYLTWLVELGPLGLGIVAVGAWLSWRRRARAPGSVIPLLIVIGAGFAFEMLEHDSTTMLFAVTLAMATVTLPTQRPPDDDAEVNAALRAPAVNT
jgi:hypothetical protein